MAFDFLPLRLLYKRLDFFFTRYPTGRLCVHRIHSYLPYVVGGPAIELRLINWFRSTFQLRESSFHYIILDQMIFS